MSQKGYSTKTIHDFLDIFNIQISHYAALYSDEAINLAVFNRAPHTGADFIAYHVARVLGIETLILQKNRHIGGSRFFHVFDADDFGQFKTSRIIAEEEPFSIKKGFEKNLDYMTQFYSRTSLVDRVRRIPIYHMFAQARRWHSYAEAWKQYKAEKQFRFFDHKLTEHKPDMDVDFVYFPLQFQPEQNTTAWGGCYDDQLLAIEQLSSRLPADWRIFVKENPQQIGYQRGKWFYERLAGIPQAKLIHRDWNTYDLLERCRFAATITGTIGWESITGGKPVLVFGPGAWYRGLPGVIPFTENFRVEEVLHTRLQHEHLERAVARLLTRCGHGEIFQRDVERVGPDDPDMNARRVAQSIERILQ